jgi:hypothetical protein
MIFFYKGCRVLPLLRTSYLILLIFLLQNLSVLIPAIQMVQLLHDTKFVLKLSTVHFFV